MILGMIYAKQQVCCTCLTRVRRDDLCKKRGMEQGDACTETRRSSPLRAPRRSTSTAVGARTPCPLRRSLLAFGIEPGQPRDAHARHANARARRSQVDAAARNSQRHVSVVSQRRVGRRSAVGRSGSAPHEEARVVIPDLAAPARRLSAAQLMRACVSSSDRTPNPGCTCVACHSKPATGLLPIWYRAR